MRTLVVEAVKARIEGVLRLGRLLGLYISSCELHRESQDVYLNSSAPVGHDLSADL